MRKPPYEYVIVHGEPGTGKSLNKEALRKHFRCDVVLDDMPSSAASMRFALRNLNAGRVLILSHTSKLRDPFDRRKLLKADHWPVQAAATALGDKWVSPYHPGIKPPQEDREDDSYDIHRSKTVITVGWDTIALLAHGKEVELRDAVLVPDSQLHNTAKKIART